MWGVLKGTAERPHVLPWLGLLSCPDGPSAQVRWNQAPKATIGHQRYDIWGYIPLGSPCGLISGAVRAGLSTPAGWSNYLAAKLPALRRHAGLHARGAARLPKGSTYCKAQEFRTLRSHVNGYNSTILP